MNVLDPLTNVCSAISSKVFGRCNFHVSDSLLGTELEVQPVQKRVFLVTWNVYGSSPPHNLKDILGLNQSEATLPDIYAIGLQEVESDDWEAAFFNALKPHGFVRIKTRRLQGILIFVFVKREHLQFVSSIESEVTKNGFYGMWGNKGASSIRFDFMGMNVIFVNCHLAPHMEATDERIMHIDNILETQKFRDRDTDNIMDHDYIFWLGDLNFRLDNLSYGRVLDLVRSEDYETLIQNDQLRQVMQEGLVFDGFQEGRVNFPPTFKFDVGTNTYDTSARQRVPSYTDRILVYHHNTQYGQTKLSANIVNYRCHPSYRNSDHKPVSAVVDISVMSKPIPSPVTFVISSKPWDKSVSKEVVYHVRKDFTVSLMDWIGIYKADFADINAQVAYVWTTMNTVPGWRFSSSVKSKVVFTSDTLSNLANGKYVLCYMTRKGSLCGISKPFIIGHVPNT